MIEYRAQGHLLGHSGRQDSKMVPKIPTPWYTCLINSLPLSVGRSCDYHGISVSWFQWCYTAKMKGFCRGNEGLKSVDPVVKRKIGLGGPNRSSPLKQGSPTLGPWTGTGSWPVRKQAAQKEVSSGWASETSSVFTAAPHRSHYRLSSASCQQYGELYNYFYYYTVIYKAHNKFNVLESSQNHPSPPVHGKIVFHETGPWCQKGWGPLL